MTNFDDRKNAFEKEFATKEEAEFKARISKYKVFAVKVAAAMGLDAEEGTIYAAQVVETFLTKDDDDALIKRAQEDLSNRGKKIDAAELQEWLHSK